MSPKLVSGAAGAALEAGVVTAALPPREKLGLAGVAAPMPKVNFGALEVGVAVVPPRENPVVAVVVWAGFGTPKESPPDAEVGAVVSPPPLKLVAPNPEIVAVPPLPPKFNPAAGAAPVPKDKPVVGVPVDAPRLRPAL